MRTALTLLIIAALAGSGWLAWALYSPVTPPTQQTFVLLHPGYSTRRIAAELKSAGVIHSTTAFILWHRLHPHRSLKAGEYAFDKATNSIEIHDRMVRGDVVIHTVIIPEGFNMFEIAQAIQAAGLGPSEDFLKVAESQTQLIADLAPDARSLEGYLFPNTYEFTRTQTMEEMAAAMVKQFRLVAREIGLSADVQKAVTLASIIEKETAAADERPLVAGVYDNRLAKNIPLQADPSVIYAELLQGAYTGALHHEDMKFPSAYNTYVHAGLPPGPIGSPGKISLEAAMHPAETPYLYFVSDGNSHHRFARSLEEHNRNVAEYRKAVARR